VGNERVKPGSQDVREIIIRDDITGEIITDAQQVEAMIGDHTGKLDIGEAISGARARSTPRNTR
jgi:hypothetical protein